MEVTVGGMDAAVEYTGMYLLRVTGMTVLNHCICIPMIKQDFALSYRTLFDRLNQHKLLSTTQFFNCNLTAQCIALTANLLLIHQR